MKKILFIAPAFFGYWKKIMNELEKKGYEVYYINQSLSTQGNIKRFIDRCASENIREKQNFYYYEKKVCKLPEDIDYVFVIKGDSLNSKIMMHFKSLFKNALFLMYQWDSSLNSPNVVEIAQYFDKVYTFDRVDAEKYSWEYRPLFFDVNDCHSSEKIYDISFICTLKFKRGEIYNQLKKISDKNNYNLFSYLYVDLKTYLKRRFFNNDIVYKSIPIKKIKFHPLTISDTGKIYDQSKIIVDYTTPTQTGLSMRTIECLGHNCKIVTNNKNIKLEKFYNENNIYIYEDKLDIPISFLKSPYKILDKNILYYYSLQGWLDSMF